MKEQAERRKIGDRRVIRRRWAGRRPEDWTRPVSLARLVCQSCGGHRDDPDGACPYCHTYRAQRCACPNCRPPTPRVRLGLALWLLLLPALASAQSALVYTIAPTRNNPQSLNRWWTLAWTATDGLTAPICIWLQRATDAEPVASVTFRRYVGTSESPALTRSDALEPFDFQGGTATNCTASVMKGWAVGRNRITATLIDEDGEEAEVAEAVFFLGQEAPPLPPPLPTSAHLAYGLTANRANPQPLSGATFDAYQPVYVFVGGLDWPAGSVQWRLTGPDYPTAGTSIDKAPPWDFGLGGTVNAGVAWTAHPGGIHTLSALVLVDGEPAGTIAAVFDVRPDLGIIDPTIVQFQASPDHAELWCGLGSETCEPEQQIVPVVTRYAVRVTDEQWHPLADYDLGKPTPDAIGMITAKLPAIAAGGPYRAWIVSVGSWGEATPAGPSERFTQQGGVTEPPPLMTGAPILVGQ